MEEFLTLLDRVLVSLRDAGHGAEATGHNLNLKAKEKLPVKNVKAYKYWLYEQGEQDTFENLVSWLEMRVQIMDETKDERRDDKSDKFTKRRRHRAKVQRLTVLGTRGSEVKRQFRRVELSVTSLNEDFSTKLHANVH